MAQVALITDGDKVNKLRRNIHAANLNHNQDGMSGHITYKGVDIRVYRGLELDAVWRGDANDTLIKQWHPEKVVVAKKPVARPMKVRRYFSGYVEVTVMARNEAEAIEVAEQYPVDSFQAENTMTFEGGAVEVEDADDDDLTYTPITNQDWIDKHIRPEFD